MIVTSRGNIIPLNMTKGNKIVTHMHIYEHIFGTKLSALSGAVSIHSGDYS